MSDRAIRFAESVRMELAALLPSVKDPRVSDAGLLTVTHVRVSDDLSVARVQVAVHGADDEQQRAVLKGLGSAAGWLKREIGRRLRAKKVPELRFHLDDTDDKAGRVEQLLREIAAEKTEKP
ncbi:MAG TPA: 30S ribosome-binding factor RbfA [Polyangia bacterium]|nr:30S ribosome-binding factor RbfA [Polyangia bacterium]